jgi:outer membrane lipoprotein-sorting protein
MKTNNARPAKLALTLAGALFALALSAPAAAQDLTVDEVVKRTNHTAYYNGDDGKSSVTMAITDSSGNTRKRVFTVMRKDVEEDGEQMFYILFHEPSDVARTTFIVHKHMTKDDDRWLYLPGLDLVKRIAGSDKRTSFVGSDFFYEDVSGRSLTEDTHELVKTSDKYYVVKNTPKNPGSVEFGHYTMHIHKKTFLPTKVEYFAKGGGKYRVMTVLAVETVQGFPTVTKAKMEDLSAGTTTVVNYKKPKYNIGLPAKVFTERYLRRAPTSYLNK